MLSDVYSKRGTIHRIKTPCLPIDKTGGISLVVKQNQEPSITLSPEYKDPGILSDNLQKLRASSYSHYKLMRSLTYQERQALKAVGFFKRNRNHIVSNSNALLDALNRLETMIQAKVLSISEFPESDPDQKGV